MTRNKLFANTFFVVTTDHFQLQKIELILTLEIINLDDSRDNSFQFDFIEFDIVKFDIFKFDIVKFDIFKFDILSSTLMSLSLDF